MNLRSLVVGAVLAFVPVAVSAQVGLYINPIAVRISNSVADSGLYAFLGQNSTSAMFYGVNFGGYYDYKTTSPIIAGIDLRDSLLHGGGAEINNFLVGLRISGRPAHSALKPYLEPAVGLGSSRAPFTQLHVKKVEYGVFAGVDYPTQHHVDFRLIEIGYGSVATAGSETIGATKTIPSSTMLTISTGLVFRFP